MAQKLTKVAETTTLATTDTLIVVDESAQNPDGSTGALKRIPKSSTGFAFPSDITSAINTEVSNRNTAITNAINTEVTNRNYAIESAVEEAKSEIDDLKANKDGRYDELTAGTAEDLITDVDFSDTDTYLFRKSPAKYNRARIDEIVGGSIVWNQNSPTTRESTTVFGMTFSITNGKAVLDGTSDYTGNGSVFRTTYSNRSVSTGHKILLTTGSDKVKPSRLQGMYSTGQIISATEGAMLDMVVAVDLVSGTSYHYEFYPQLFDLTQMFGSSVADYIYSLESAEAGKGVAFFKSLFPNDYYPYNAGELLSVEGLQSHDMVGFNQWDEEWELGKYDNTTGAKVASDNTIRSKNMIPILPNTSYYPYFPYPTQMSGFALVFYYDANGAFISRANVNANGELGAITTPSNAYYMTFFVSTLYGTTYKNDICINLSWSGWRNGEYEPYKKHSYPLDSSLTLRGIPKLNSQNELYFDGDIYSHDGKVTRRYAYFKATTVYGVATIGDYTRFALNGVTETATSPTARKQMCSYGIPLLWEYGTESEHFYIDDTSIIVALKSSTVGTTKASIESYIATHPLEFVYELATPTEETAEPFNNIQITLKDGTEQYISSSIVPPYSTTYYLESLEHKIKKDSAIIKSASGSVASFKDGGEDMPLKGLNVNIVPKQSGSGDPSPSNVRPISGWSAVNVNRVGKNLFDLSSLHQGNMYGGTPDVDVSIDCIAIKGGQNYTLNSIVTDGRYIRFYDSQQVELSSERISYYSAYPIWNFTAPSNASYLRVCWYQTDGLTTETITASNPQLEEGTSATAYEPYQGTSYPISLGQTVYGGTLDVVSGVLTLTKGFVDLGSLSWYYDSANVLFSAVLPNDCVPNSALGGDGVCSQYKRYTGATNFWTAMGNNEFCYARSGYSSAKQVYIKDSRYTTASDFKTAMNGVQLVYELATPTEITLTPTQVKTLLGANNIWSDSGTVEVEYRADTTLAYNELLSLIASL